MTFSINEWAAPFLDDLRKYHSCKDFILVYDNVYGMFGVASTDAKLLYQGDNKSYFTSYFERILTKFWNKSNVQNWTRFEPYYSGSIFCFVKQVCNEPHTTCIIEAKRESATKDVVKNFLRLYLKGRVVKTANPFAKNFSTENVSVLLEMDEKTVLEFSSKIKLCFKKLSKKARAPRRATDKSVGYDLYAAKEAVVPLLCKLILTGNAMSCPPGLHPRVAPRSSLACKNTKVGAGVIDFNYRGNVKVLMMNCSQENLNINLGDCIAQFFLTRYKTPDVEEIDELDSTSRDINGFSSTVA